MNVIERATTLKIGQFCSHKEYSTERSDFVLCFATDACQTTAGVVHKESEFWTDIRDKFTDMQLYILNCTEIHCSKYVLIVCWVGGNAWILISFLYKLYRSVDNALYY